MTTLTAAERGTTYRDQESIFVESCANCGILFGIPRSYEKRRRSDQRSFYCPNGHSNHYPGETEEQKLQKQLDQKNREADHLREHAGRMAAERDQAKASARGQKAAKTRLKNKLEAEREKIATGTCPCCNRRFAGLKEHMDKVHPDYTMPEPD